MIFEEMPSFFMHGKTIIIIIMSVASLAEVFLDEVKCQSGGSNGLIFIQDEPSLMQDSSQRCRLWSSL